MKDADNEVARVKADLDRYNHYFERFIGHEGAKRAIPKFKDLAKKKADQVNNKKSYFDTFTSVLTLKTIHIYSTEKP